MPGLVIALACAETAVLCIAKVAKKTAFITHAAATLRLENLKARHVAVESMTDQQFDLIARFVPEPMPLEMISGIMPATKANVVIRIGRSRSRLARTMASCVERPVSFN